eukprot:gene3064-5234_t
MFETAKGKRKTTFNIKDISIKSHRSSAPSLIIHPQKKERINRKSLSKRNTSEAYIEKPETINCSVSLPKYEEISKKFTFSFVTLDEKCSIFFRKFSQRFLCFENLFFYEATIRFKKVKDIHLKRQTCLMIIQGFMIKGSTIELNISKEEKEKSAIKFEKLQENECPDDFFDEYLPSVVYMLKIETYPLFLKSQEFVDYYSKFGIKIL